MGEKAQDVKEVKRYLRQARELDILIHTKQDEQAKLRELAEGLSSPRIGDRIASGKGNTSMQTVDRIVDLQTEIDEEIAKLVERIREIHDNIEKLDNPIERAVLTERYINVRSWEDIAGIIGYTVRQTLNIHGKALKHFTFFHLISLNFTNSI